MITEKDIERINELYKKSKTPEGLTAEERREQAELRSAYLNSIRANLKGQLDTIKIQKPDGTLVDLKKKHQENMPAVILEFKVYNPRKEASLEETVKEALKQIEEKQYDAELIAQGIRKEQIQHYGFAFEGKKVLIG